MRGLLDPGRYKNIAELRLAFPDEASCLKHINDVLFDGVRYCLHCDNTEFYTFKKRPYTYECKKCRKQMSALSGTLFQETRIPLISWFCAIYYLTKNKTGISAQALADEINITRHTAWSIMHRFREVEKKTLPKIEVIRIDNYNIEVTPQAETEMLCGEVEIDEVYLGGRNMNKHANKKVKGVQGTSQQIKVPVLGMYERHTGRVICIPVKDITGPGLFAVIKRYVAKGSTIYTDENSAYNDLDRLTKVKVVKPKDERDFVKLREYLDSERILDCENEIGREEVIREPYYKRGFTNHSKHEYVKGDIHTNNIERVWAMLRRGIMGTYYHMSEKHLSRYIAEFAFRIKYNNLSQEEVFDLALKHCDKPFPKKELIKSNSRLNNYSGRGKDFPKERQAKTLVRGAYSRKHKDFFEGEAKQEVPIGNDISDEVLLGDENGEDFLYQGDNISGTYEMKRRDTEEPITKKYQMRWYRDRLNERYPYPDVQLDPVKRKRGRPRKIKVQIVTVKPKIGRPLGSKNKPKIAVKTEAVIEVKKVTSIKKA